MSITPNGTATPAATAVVFDEAGGGAEDDVAGSGSVARGFLSGEESIPSRHFLGPIGRIPGRVGAATAVDIGIRAETEARGQTDGATNPAGELAACAVLSVLGGSGIAGRIDGIALVGSAAVWEIACCRRVDDGDETGERKREEELMAQKGKHRGLWRSSSEVLDISGLKEMQTSSPEQ
ncbi:MAG: hypothetical protein Q9199_007174 [Rusavskia elegans]